MPEKSSSSESRPDMSSAGTKRSSVPDRILKTATARVVMVLAICLSLYQLYTAGIMPLTALVQRSIHLGAILSLTFLLKPPFKKARKDTFTFWLFLDWSPNQ